MAWGKKESCFSKFGTKVKAFWLLSYVFSRLDSISWSFCLYKLVDFRLEMLRNRERPLDHILHHCEFTVNFPMVSVILFTLLQQRSLHQLPKESIPHFERVFFPKAHAPSFSWNPHSQLHPVLTDCTTSHLENLSWLLRTLYYCISMEFVSRFYPLPFLRIAEVRVCLCCLKKAVALYLGERVSSALVFQRYLPEEKTCALMVSSCISIFWAEWTPSSTEGRGRGCTPN